MKSRKQSNPNLAPSASPDRIKATTEAAIEAFWDDTENRFFRLHNEQVSEKSCLHASKDGDAWTVGGGTQNAKQQFEWLAERAALRLGVPPGRDPVFSWLDRLKKESPRYKPFKSNRKRRKSELDSDEMCSLEYEITQSEDGPIEFLCKASAEYCIRCETQEKVKGERLHPAPTPKRKGYRLEVKLWMQQKNLENLEQASRKLYVSQSTLKSVMSDRGKARFSQETLARILKEISR